MSNMDSHEPQISAQDAHLLNQAFQQIAPAETALSNCRFRVETSGRKRVSLSVYLGLAAVVLVSWGIIFLIPAPSVSEPVFTPEPPITLPNGARLIINRGTIVKIQETENKLILQQGWIQLKCQGSQPIKIIAPPNSQIKRGADFVIDDISPTISSGQVFLVSGSIELSTSH